MKLKWLARFRVNKLWEERKEEKPNNQIVEPNWAKLERQSSL